MPTVANRHTKLGKTTTKKEKDKIPLMLLTNSPTELKQQTLLMLYQSLEYGQLGYMDGKDPDTGEIVPLLVGMDPRPNGKFNLYPLAKLIMGETKGYLAPDGRGNYIAGTPTNGEPEPIAGSLTAATTEGQAQGVN